LFVTLRTHEALTQLGNLEANLQVQRTDILVRESSVEVEDTSGREVATIVICAARPVVVSLRGAMMTSTEPPVMPKNVCMSSYGPVTESKNCWTKANPLAPERGVVRDRDIARGPLLELPGNQKPRLPQSAPHCVSFVSHQGEEALSNFSSCFLYFHAISGPKLWMLSPGIRGEVRLVERAFGLGRSIMTEGFAWGKAGIS
jgi:hypothetical protein